jgi:hypothetical protein
VPLNCSPFVEAAGHRIILRRPCVRAASAISSEHEVLLCAPFPTLATCPNVRGPGANAECLALFRAGRTVACSPCGNTDSGQLFLTALATEHDNGGHVMAFEPRPLAPLFSKVLDHPPCSFLMVFLLGTRDHRRSGIPHSTPRQSEAERSDKTQQQWVTDDLSQKSASNCTTRTRMQTGGQHGTCSRGGGGVFRAS